MELEEGSDVKDLEAGGGGPLRGAVRHLSGGVGWAVEPGRAPPVSGV